MARHRILQTIVFPAAALVALAACGGKAAAPTAEGEQASGAASSVVSPATEPKSTPAPAVAPLTGVVAKGTTVARVKGPALAVKIDNDPHARPQIGLNQADLVYEEEVEGITRFVAVFHSHDSSPVGPIRSARSSDIDIIGNLNRPLFAWSGANPTVIGEVNAARDRGVLVNVNHDTKPQHYVRDGSRYAPYNLYSDTKVLRAEAPAGAKPPAPVFRYRKAGDKLGKGARLAVRGSLAFRGDGRITGVQFRWDPELGGWARYQTDLLHQGAETAHLDANGVQIAPQNVVVLFVQYTISAAGVSPQALTVGSGDALVLTKGHAIDARWSRPSPTSPIDLRTAAGVPVKLTPGRTWVALPLPGAATVG